MPRDVQTEGIVLRARTYGEDDLLVELLTPEDGRISGIARHGRKSRKRFGTVLEPLNLLRLRYQDRGTMVSLREVVLETPLTHLSEDWDRLMAAFYLVDIVRETVHERSSDSHLYHLLKESLLSLDRGTPVREALQNFEFHFLDSQGYQPHIEACRSCGKKWDESGPFYFVFREGGLYCLECLPPRVDFEPFSKGTLPKILSRFIEYQLGRPLKASRFLRGVL